MVVGAKGLRCDAPGLACGAAAFGGAARAFVCGAAAFGCDAAALACGAAAVGEMLAGLQAAGEPLRALLEHDGITAACLADCMAQPAAALAARDARQQAMAGLARRVRVQVNALLRRHPEVARPAGFD